jgi:excisionase family DNA binding protein
MFTVQEVAEKLNVSPATVYDAVASGELPHHRIGRGRGTIRVSEEQLRAYLRRTEMGRAEVISPAPHVKLKHLS